MVIDASAVLAILFGEDGAERYSDHIEADSTRLISAASVLEAAMVAGSRKGPSGERELDLLLFGAGIETIAFNQEQLKVARHAFRTYGKGQHPAGLNFGNCFSYALSKTAGEPLLFKGDDFAKTDVVSCL